ncbi:MAG: HAD-IC family P-type ATPase [Chlamydiota bacterium]
MWHTKNVAEFFVEKEGLSPEKVNALQKKFGSNELKVKKKKHLLQIFFLQCVNPLVGILFVACLIKCFLGSYLEGGVIFLTTLIMVLVGFIQEAKAENAVAALLKLTTLSARVRRKGEVETVPTKELVPGDLLLLEAGDKVPADARLVEVYELQMNESFLTGESLPVEKSQEALPENTPLASQTNMVFSGTLVTSGKGLAYLTATGMDTALGKITSSIQEMETEPSPLQRNIKQLSQFMLVVVMLFALCFIGLGAFLGLTWIEISLLTIALAVAAIPEGLPATVTAVLAVGVRRIARKKGLIRKLVAVETLGSADVICTDKTGTLTNNAMQWTDLITAEEKLACHQVTKTDLQSRACRKLIDIAYLCNNAVKKEQERGAEYLGDPTEVGLIKTLHELFSPFLPKTNKRLFEVPFSSERRYMATLCDLDGEIEVLLKGSPEVIVSFCTKYLGKRGIEPLSPDRKNALLEEAKQLAKSGMRVLGGAYKAQNTYSKKIGEKELTRDAIFVGFYGMSDPLREGVKQAVDECRQAGITVLILTGDSPETAMHIGQSLGLKAQSALIGTDIEKLSPKELVEKAEETSIFARIEPMHKLRIVSALKSDGHILAMTGDGVNDAPALEKADIGIAMGKEGTDVAKEASDLILVDDAFETILACIEEGRSIFTRIRSSALFLLTTCFGEVGTIFLVFFAWQKAPLEPIQILWINLITGSLIAIPLGLEPKTGHELHHPPRDARVGLLYPGMIWRILFLSILMSLSAFALFSFYEETLVKARSVTFAMIVLFEWFLAFHVRSDERSPFALGFFSNPSLALMGLVAFGLLFLLLYVPFLGKIFQTVPLSLQDWGLCLLPGALMFCLESIRKRLYPKIFSFGKWRVKHWD